MNISSKLDQLHLRVRENLWFKYFAVFNRVALAAGFLPSGMQKVLGERFTVLVVAHPMGHFLDAFFQTGYYYTFVGLLQVSAAILLLIPRTATLGAVIYFPIILNICILSFAVRFEGSMFTAPLMVMACLYLICWDYHKFKFILPFNHTTLNSTILERTGLNKKFPTFFFAGVFAVAVTVLVINIYAYELEPYNTLSDCKKQCDDIENPDACLEFCNCIHKEGRSLDECLDEYDGTFSNNIQTE